jgi:hypothetical protein
VVFGFKGDYFVLGDDRFDSGMFVGRRSPQKTKSTRRLFTQSHGVWLFVLK